MLLDDAESLLLEFDRAVTIGAASQLNRVTRVRQPLRSLFVGRGAGRARFSDHLAFPARRHPQVSGAETLPIPLVAGGENWFAVRVLETATRPNGLAVEC